MFHVEPILKRYKFKEILIGFSVCVLLFSCIASRQTTQIPDYLLVPNGKEILENKGLTAFVFENNQTKIPIEQFLSMKFNTDNYTEKEFWVTIDKDKYKIIVYDYSEFEKYFNSANFSPINQVPDNAKKGDARTFIAISLINAYNEDCLTDHSLFQNTAIKYLKKLKDEFYNQ